MVSTFIVDDEAIIRNGLKNSVPWRENGFDVVGDADDGSTALPLVKKLSPDLIITDISMPIMDGLELAEEVMRFNDRIKIIILTGYDQFGYAQRAIRLNISDYILKPVENDELIRTAKKVCAHLPGLADKNAEASLFINGERRSEVVRAHEYMRANYMMPLTLQQVAEYIHLSPSYLSRVLKRDTGRGFVDLLAEIRVLRAAELLGDGELRIYSIAEMVGYSDPAYFCHIFKQQMGKTPYEYRREKLSNG